jgi:NADH-quinone oxidoreductase subunit C
VIADEDIIDVESDSWLQACVSLRDRGLVAVDWLSAVDVGQRLLVLVHLVEPGTGNEAIVRTSLPADAPGIASLAEKFPGADWHERETAEMFGLQFDGRTSTLPLLLRGEVGVPPLRKQAPLAERVNTPWPGEDDAAATRRRRKLPPGVRSEWVESDE